MHLHGLHDAGFYNGGYNRCSTSVALYNACMYSYSVSVYSVIVVNLLFQDAQVLTWYVTMETVYILLSDWIHVLGFQIASAGI